MKIAGGCVLAVFLLLVAYLIFKSRYKKAGPDEALIVFGRKKLMGRKVRDAEGAVESFRIIRGGGTFVTPALEGFSHLSPLVSKYNPAPVDPLRVGA